MKIGWKILIWITFIVLSIIAINPFLALNKGVVVSEISNNSSAALAGLSAGEIIKEINGKKINNINDYSKIISELFKGEKIKLEIKTNKGNYAFFADKPEFTVRELKKSRLQLGLELQGGSRALIKPVEKIDQTTLDNMQKIMEERFNVYGIRDIKINQIRDLEGNKYLLIEMAGASPKELRDLISTQGKFEAKIGNNTVFVGGKKDITSVCQTPECSGILSCDEISNAYICKFQFAVYLSQEAAKKQAEITKNLEVNITNPQYLNETLDLYLDDILVDNLFISTELKGKETTQVAISGSGIGKTKTEAYNDALSNMKKLQSILLTGSLPIKIEIEKIDTVSPILGKEFLKNIIIIAIIAILLVSLIVFIRYKNPIISFIIILTLISEIIIILGIASWINWNLDLASIAGIITAIGTGVDDQIIIIDETKFGRTLSLKERIKRAFFIIFGSYATTLVALLPLMWSGAGLLKGFAITTIIGISVGVFITRPAFGELVKRVIKE
ncbi:MAG: site-2 protease family protein [Candidatus Pacearchaeota archaeon]